MKFYKIILEDGNHICKVCGSKFITLTCDLNDIYDIEPCAVCGSKEYRSKENNYGNLWKLGELINQRLVSND